MTGHSTINAEQNQEFLSTMHTMIDDLDTISSNIDEHTYLRLANGLQRLYNIHNSSNQTSSNNYETSNSTSTSTSTSYANPPITTPINYTRTDYISNISDISNASLSNYDISNANTANTNANNNNNENIQSRIQSLNEESNRIGYSVRTRLALYNNVFNA